MPEAGLDSAGLGAWLAGLGIGHSGALTLTRVGLGQSNLTYEAADSAGHRWIVRRPPLGKLLASAHDVAREARILSALADTDVPVPRILGVRYGGGAGAPELGEDSDGPGGDAVAPESGLDSGGSGDAGVPLVLMEFVDGLVLDRRDTVDAVAEPTRHAIGLSLARTLAKIHAVDLDKTGLADIASHKPYAERQLRRWSAQWQQSKTRELPDLDDLTARLSAAVPEQRELTLVHGDFHLRNVIVSPADGAVVSVLDWELCTLGDPLADLGSLLAYWPEPGEPGAGPLGFSALPGFPSREEMARAYLDACGRDGAALGFWHALGLWKIAIIAEGILRRVLDEPRNRAAGFTPTPDMIDTLVDKARAVAAEAGI